MSIDFYALHPKGEKELIFQMEYDAFDALAVANDSLERKAGTFIDPYGTTRVSTAHARIFLEALQSELIRGRFKNRSTQEMVRTVCKVLETACNQERSLLVEGE